MKLKATLTRVMEEQRIVGLCVFDQPMHSPQNVLFRRLAHGVLLIVGQDHHVFTGVSEIAVQVTRHVFHIVDASSQLPFLSKVVDTDQQGLTPACTARVLEIVTLRCALAKAMVPLRRWRRGVMVSLDIGV